MSWSVGFVGPREAAHAALLSQFASALNSYGADTEEGRDIVAARGRTFALLDALHLDEGQGVNVTAHGSHATWNGALSEASLHISVQRVDLKP